MTWIARLAPLALATPLAAQAFTPGDLYAQLTLGPVTHTALARIDPGSGTLTEIITPAFSNGFSSLVWDGHREKLLHFWRPNASTPFGLYAVDALGGQELLVVTGNIGQTLTTTGDGRAYFLNAALANRLQYVDAAGALHFVEDATTGLDWAPPFPATGMLYEASTNSLIIATTGGFLTGCDDGIAQLAVRRVQLSADGAKVTGVVACTEIEVWTAGVNPLGMALLPDGDILLVTGAPLGNNQPHTFRIDPTTLAWSTFASAGEPVSGLFLPNSGTWSPAHGKAAMLELHSNTLRLVAEGGSGPGTSLPLGADIIINHETLLAIPASSGGCAGAYALYGAGLAGQGGVVPVLGAKGCAEIGSLFALEVDEVLGGASGLLFVGLSSASVPFKGGSFLVGSLALSVPVVAGGPAGVTSAGSISLPAIVTDPLLSGLDLFLQAGFSDAAAVHDVSLTNGLQITLG